MSWTNHAKRIALIGTGLILLAVGIILLIGGYNDNRLHGESLKSLQFQVGGAIIGVTAVFLLWRGSKK